MSGAIASGRYQPVRLHRLGALSRTEVDEYVSFVPMISVISSLEHEVRSVA